MAGRTATAVGDARGDIREEVLHRTRGTAADGRSIQLVIVNISARGLMARCDGVHHAGERITVQLPVVGTVSAAIRWSLGGRIGCEFDDAVPTARYYGLLATMMRTS